jgi:hypothetical protein
MTTWGGSGESIETVSTTTGITSTTEITKKHTVGTEGTFRALSISAGYEQSWIDTLIIESSATQTLEYIFEYICPPHTRCDTYQLSATFEFTLKGKVIAYTVAGGNYRTENSRPPDNSIKTIASSPVPDDACKNGAALSAASNAIVLGISIVIFLVSW